MTDAEAAVLAATEALLSEVPLRELSVARIIHHAGISRATFYFYFGSKFAVLAALLRQAIAEISAVSRTRLHEDPSTPAALTLRRRIRDSARVWDEHRPVLCAAVESWQLLPELRELWLDLIGGLTDAITAEIERERAGGHALAHTGDPRALAAMLAWTTERVFYVIGLDVPGGSRDVEGSLEALTQIWGSVVLAPEELAAPAA